MPAPPVFSPQLSLAGPLRVAGIVGVDGSGNRPMSWTMCAGAGAAALGDATRFRIVQEIGAGGELCCGEVADRFDSHAADDLASSQGSRARPGAVSAKPGQAPLHLAEPAVVVDLADQLPAGSCGRIGPALRDRARPAPGAAAKLAGCGREAAQRALDVDTPGAGAPRRFATRQPRRRRRLPAAAPPPSPPPPPLRQPDRRHPPTRADTGAAGFPRRTAPSACRTAASTAAPGLACGSAGSGAPAAAPPAAILPERVDVAAASHRAETE